MHSGQKIRELREKRGWTQAHLAEASGLSLRTIQRIERNGKASKESMLALAAVFECEIMELFSDTSIIESEISQGKGLISWLNKRFQKLEQFLDSYQKSLWLTSIIVAFPGTYFFLANILNYYLKITWFILPIRWIMSYPTGNYWFNLISPFIFVGGLSAAILINVLLILRGRFYIKRNELQSSISIKFRKPVFLSLIIFGSIMGGMLLYIVAENLQIH